jgi:hypothetical protein
MRADATTWLRRVRAFRVLGMGVARLAGCDSLASSDLRSGQGVWILMAVLELRRGARSDELRRDSCTFLEHAMFTFVYLRLLLFTFRLLLFTFVYCLPFWHLNVAF